MLQDCSQPMFTYTSVCCQFLARWITKLSLFSFCIPALILCVCVNGECKLVVPPWGHFPTCMPASSRGQPIPRLPLRSLRASLVGITWFPQEKPNQATTKLNASFICRQNSAVEIPICLRLIIYCYLTTGNHDPGGRSRVQRSLQVLRCAASSLDCGKDRDDKKWWVVEELIYFH